MKLQLTKICGMPTKARKGNSVPLNAYIKKKI